MKARAEGMAARRGDEIKRGVGGLRDIEFAVQLLQLVHGRADPSLRRVHTLRGAPRPGRRRLRRAPTTPAPWKTPTAGCATWSTACNSPRCGAPTRSPPPPPPGTAWPGPWATATAPAPPPASASTPTWWPAGRRCGPSTSASSTGRCSRPSPPPPPPGSPRRERPGSWPPWGSRTPPAPRRAFDELTAGLSRRSRLMQQLLPLMLGWLSDSPDPDLGLEQLRLLVAETPDHAALIAALRDNPVAAERLCTLLGTSRLLGRLLDRLPPALARLGDDAALAAFPDRDGAHRRGHPPHRGPPPLGGGRRRRAPFPGGPRPVARRPGPGRRRRRRRDR